MSTKSKVTLLAVFILATILLFNLNSVLAFSSASPDLTQDPRTIAAKLISIVIGIILIVSLIFLIFAIIGLIVNKKNKEKSKKFKTLLVVSLFGFLNILFMWGIAHFVVLTGLCFPEHDAVFTKIQNKKNIVYFIGLILVIIAFYAGFNRNKNKLNKKILVFTIMGLNILIYCWLIIHMTAPVIC